MRSTSRAGMSSIVVELRDDAVAVDPIWSRVRDRLGDAEAELPDEALRPEFRRLELKAYAAILALVWDRDGTANMAVLGRVAEELRQSLLNLTGVDEVDLFGEPAEEISVELEPAVLSSLGLSTAAVSQQIRDSDATTPAGSLRIGEGDLLIDVQSARDSADRLGDVQIQFGPRGEKVDLADVATIRKAIVNPPDSVALADGRRAVVAGVLIRDSLRIDHWSQQLHETVDEFRQNVSGGLDVEILFEQSEYVEASMSRLRKNLLQGALAVIVVVYLLMGWRSTIVVATALPLSALLVLTGMRVLGIPIHQMSITGLIVALGLLIDNAIVIVDEVRSRIWKGFPQRQAIVAAVRQLAMPLFGSTLTTTLAFAPIAMLPGPPGEYVGSIAMSVILAINASFLLAMTITPALTALTQKVSPSTILSFGLQSDSLRRFYEGTLRFVFRTPVLGVALGAALPVVGYLQLSKLPEQFFPPAERNQIYLELELAANATTDETRAVADAVREVVMQDDQVKRVDWFVGESGPSFFYNVVPRRLGVPSYAQAIVELESNDGRETIHSLQRELDERFVNCRVLVRQLEQGPPFDAPIEIQLYGPDLATLQELGGAVRLLLSQTTDVIHTRSDLEETQVKLELQVDADASRLAGLTSNEIARQLYTTLNGADGGAVREGSEELPIRVRIADPQQLTPEQLATVELAPPPRRGPQGPPGVAPEGAAPISAVASLELSSDSAAIPHIDGRRVNEVKAYLKAGTLPSKVLAEFESRLAAADFQLPPGYSMRFGGEAAERDEAVGSLMANAVILFSLMLVSLVVAFRSFRAAMIVAAVGALSIGLGPGALRWFGYPFGFMAIVGSMGLAGVAINDAIVVLAGIRDDPRAAGGDRTAMVEVVVGRVVGGVVGVVGGAV
ncbi:MAG: efflux RND transporter permease subunit, partial [Planctomycetota bacterium]